MGFLRGNARALSLDTGKFWRRLSFVIADESADLSVAILIAN